MFQQMRLLLQAQRHRDSGGQSGRLSSMTEQCQSVLEMAIVGGATAVGLKDVIGSITPGKRADLLIIRCESTRLTRLSMTQSRLLCFTQTPRTLTRCL
jgi:cytosine/adenosine deaminase-related metal-dependent hydrolase